MAKFQTHYDNLKVARNAPDSVIRAAYKALMQQYHPDKYKGDESEANRICKIINESYQILIDPVKRLEHDRWINKQEAKKDKTEFGNAHATTKPAREENAHRDGEYDQPIKSQSYAWAYVVALILLIIWFVGIRSSGPKIIKTANTKVSPTLKTTPQYEQPSTTTSPSTPQSARPSTETSPLTPQFAEPSTETSPSILQSSRPNTANTPPISKIEKNELPKIEMIKIPIGILIGKYEVTQGQWRAVMGNHPDSGVSYPVEQVSWDDVEQFIQRLNSRTGKRYRLPTEDEWYNACQAGSNTRYCGSDNVDELGWYQGNSGGATHPVGQKKPNAWGLHDMSGNVWEWTSNCYWGDCSRRVIRGGSWYSGPDAHANSFDSDSTTVRGYDVGFRLAQDP